MFCEHCGKKNPEGSKFCQHCGLEAGGTTKTVRVKHGENDLLDKYIDQDIAPYPYVISIGKLVVMCVATVGIYEVYWFYRQWKSFNAENKLNHGGFSLWIYALFSPLSSYSLFKHVSSDVKEVNKGKGLEAGALAIAYFFLTRLWLGFIPLVSVQNRINLYWEKKYDDKLVRSNFGVWNWIIIVVVFVVFIAIYYQDSPDISSSTPEAPVFDNYNQDEIVSSVVNIFCPSTVEGEDGSGGSGTILTEEGIILTNSHIIPQDKINHHVGEDGCLVVLPDPITGQPDEVFLAHPIIIPEISDNYDLAYMQIYSAYYDEEEERYAGTYPRVFPAFDDTTRCRNENVQLGESVRIFGYPAISGGFSLTITDGVVSSFPGDGLIVTSAKISHGNSGGLAVDKHGCMIGVPSLVSSDDSESLGVIYSTNLTNEFSSEVSKYLDKK